MSLATIAPEYELFPDRYRWPVAECHRLAEEGRLVGRYEILDGEVVSKMGQKPAHFFCITALTHWLNIIFGDQYVRGQGPIAIPAPDSEFTEPEPDLAVTAEPRTAYSARHPGPEDLILVVEISDTSIRTDLVIKARLYAREQIPEFWTLDVNARQLYIHREPANGVYNTITIHGENENVTVGARPGAPIAVADLLPPMDA